MGELNFATGRWNTLLGSIFYTNNPLACTFLVYCIICFCFAVADNGSSIYTTRLATVQLIPPQAAVTPCCGRSACHRRVLCLPYRRFFQLRRYHRTSLSLCHHISPSPLSLFTQGLWHLQVHFSIIVFNPRIFVLATTEMLKVETVFPPPAPKEKKSLQHHRMHKWKKNRPTCTFLIATHVYAWPAGTRTNGGKGLFKEF